MRSFDTDIATEFFLDDVFKSVIPGTRMYGVLQNVLAQRPLTVFQQEFLNRRGYIALLQFSSGELDLETFRVQASAEQECRLNARAVSEKNVAAEKHARAEVTNRKNTDLFAKHEKKLQGRRFRARFGQGYIEREDYGRVMHILKSVDEGKQIDEDSLVWLGADGSEYWTDELRKAHHEILAKICTGEWRSTGDGWKAVNACGHWRKADLPENGIEIVKEALGQKTVVTMRSALMTTGGGALRDLGRFSEAVKFGIEAHSLTPKDFRPCTLLGAVHMELGAYVEGLEWFDKAEVRGASKNIVDRELQSILRAAPIEKRKQMKNALKIYSVTRFSWL